MQSSHARSWSFAGLVTLASLAFMPSAAWGGEPLNLQAQTPAQAQQQLNDVAKEGRDNSRYWQDKHEKERTNDALDSIEDAIILNGDEEGND